MKKAMFLGIAALLALAVISCNNPSAPENGGGGIDAWDLSGEPPLQPGEFFVGYNAGNGSRALTSPLAKAGSDYFEAVMVADYTGGTPTVHRSVFREGRYGRMMPPSTGDFSNTGTDLKAYLFAGRNDDKTLLGIGVITQVDNGSGWITSATISQATRGVAFTIEPLTTDVNTDACLTTPPVAVNTSTFKPWNTTSLYEVDVSARIMIDNLPASIFLLPAAGPVNATYDIKTSNGAAVVVSTGTPPPGVVSRGYIWSDNDYAPIEVPATVGTMIAIPASTYPTNNDGIRFPLTINTQSAGAASGLGRLSLEVPVVNLSDADAANQEIPDLKKPTIWYIRGGMNNALIDQGNKFNQNRGSMGGAILIGVGNVLSGAGGFIIEPKY